jgi:transposase
MRRFPQGRPRKLSSFQERVLLEEVRMGRWFTQKRIAERHNIGLRTLEEYVSRARLEGLL